ncbi:hypothetical protein [Edaphobacter dinghuensis]|uniref:Outer membrane protein beta-barrel domain-containing protein n=1 Tax=Edaphobacter dinghuensis TaxID=1560005 RepID=A0A917H4Q8_9BACT|nr:hypothetical protein [Edaphobacter dinghuensis]GGG67449.1 hypothetical protein GCM10011585_06670 [Edaphobacter dinghuensis]
MNFRKALLLLAVALFVTATAHAQFGVYGTFTANHLSGIKSSPDVTTTNAVNNDVSPLGGTGGIYYDFFKLGHLAKLGVDARGTITTTKRGAYVNANGGGSRINSGLFGVRAVFDAPVLHTILRPYVQGSVGIGSSNYGILYGSNGVVTRNNFEYMGFAGVDIPLAPFMDLRLVELGAGALSNSHTYPLQSVSSGIVFHLPF